MHKQIFRWVLFILFVIFIGGLGGIVADQYVFPKLSARPTFSRYAWLRRAMENVTIINKTEQVMVKEEDSINKIAAQASNSMVQIISSRRSEGIRTVLPPEHSFVSGTGIIVTSDGLIATYRTALLEGKNVYGYSVFLKDGNVYPAELVGIDEYTNLAFLKIAASNLSAIAIANSDDVYAGKKIILIASNADQGQNRCAGGILGLRNKTFNISGKTLASSEKLEGVFEVDLENLSEYVGGAFIDYNGALQGITGVTTLNNTPHYFQIPANVVRNSIDLAIRNAFANRPFLGVYYLSITKALKQNMNLAESHGALVYAPSGKQSLAILANSPAEEAGIHINDIILKINNQEINIDNPLSDVLTRFTKGQEITIMLLRAGQEMTIPVKL